jgi:hypothetical protein
LAEGLACLAAAGLECAVDERGTGISIILGGNNIAQWPHQKIDEAAFDEKKTLTTVTPR